MVTRMDERGHTKCAKNRLFLCFLAWGPIQCSRADPGAEPRNLKSVLNISADEFFLYLLWLWIGAI